MGRKLEYVLRDAIGRDWQCGTVQVDLNLPGRLGAFYIDTDGNKVHPVMIHRALFGSLERFTGILIEHYAGHFPLWLAPLQVVVATITSEADDYARDVARKLTAAGLNVETDLAATRRSTTRFVSIHWPRFLRFSFVAKRKPTSRAYRSVVSVPSIRLPCLWMRPLRRSLMKLSLRILRRAHGSCKSGSG